MALELWSQNDIIKVKMEESELLGDFDGDVYMREALIILIIMMQRRK